jgi:hypothetical protein
MIGDKVFFSPDHNVAKVFGGDKVIAALQGIGKEAPLSVRAKAYCMIGLFFFIRPAASRIQPLAAQLAARTATKKALADQLS